MTASLSLALISREFPPFSGGGIGTYAEAATRALSEAGVRVHVITHAHEGAASVAIEGGVTVHRMPVAGMPAETSLLPIRFGALAARRAMELHREGAIDIVEAPECEAPGFGLAAMRGMGAPGAPPLVAHLHTPTEQLRALRSLGMGNAMTGPLAAWIIAERASMLGATAVCAPSAFIADWAHECYALPARPTILRYPLAQRPRREAPRPRKVVLYVGRIEPRKGVEELLEAWVAVARRRPEWSLRLAGADTSTGPGSTSLRGALESALPDDVRARTAFLGPLGAADLDQERARAAICVIPSRWENFPYTCIEAMAAGRAVLVSDQGGMREMVGDSEGGRIHRAGDARDLAAELSDLMSEGLERLAARGRAAQLQIGRLCDPARTTAERIDFLREVIGRHGLERRRTHQDRRRARARLELWRSLRAAGGGEMERLALPPAPAPRDRGGGRAPDACREDLTEMQPASPPRRYPL